MTLPSPDTPASPAPASIHLRLTGTPAWRRAAPEGDAGHAPGTEAASTPSIPGGPLARKDAALLAILAWDGPTARERLITLLWSGTSPAQAMNSLRQRLFRLRRDCGHELVTNQAVLQLAPGVDTDLAQAGAEAGELLGGLDFGDDDVLEEWVQAARAQWRERRIDALTARAAGTEAAGQWAQALRDTQAIIDLAPLQEHAWRRLMRLHYLRGDRAAAVLAFEQFERRLRDELGARPSAETLAQLALVESAAPLPAAPRRPVPAALVRPPRTVGRAAERAQMEAAWQAGRAFVLIGPAGMGKTRLLDDFLAGHATHPAPSSGGDDNQRRPHAQPAVIREQGRPGDERSPYATTLRWLQALLEAWPEACAEADRPEIARLLPAWGEPPRQPGHQAALWHAIERVLLRARDRGLRALAVDDLQFADDASLDLLRWLVPGQRLAGLRFALATRPIDHGTQRDTLAAWWTDSGRPQPVRLDVLDERALQELLTTLDLPEAPAAQAAAQAAALMRHAGGHPYFTLETLKEMVLRGGGEATGDGPGEGPGEGTGVESTGDAPASLATLATPPSALPRPGSVQALLARRLASLPADARDLVRVAAVAGSDLTLERAARMLERSPIALAEPWAVLEAAGVLRDTGFVHDLMRETALDSVPPPVRTHLHAALAAQLAQDPRVPPGRVAGHWLAAARWPEAGAALREAGHAAYRAGRLPEHGQLLHRAAECFERSGDNAARFQVLCAALDSLLVRQGGQAVLDAAPALEPLATSDEQRAELLQVQCEALMNLARFEDVPPLAERLQPLTVHLPHLHVDTLSMTGRALTHLGRLAEARVQLDAALASGQALAEATGRREPLARAWGHRVDLMMACGRTAEADEASARAAELALAIGDPADHAIHVANRATIAALRGDAPTSYVQALKAREAYARVGAEDGQMSAINEISIGLAAAAQGQLGVAGVALQRAMRLLGDTGPAAAIVKVRAALAEFELFAGRPERARAVLSPAHRPAVGGPWGAIWDLIHARTLEAVGAPAAEIAAARQAGMAMAPVESALLAAPLLLRHWVEHIDPVQARALLQRAVDQAESSDRPGLARSLRLVLLDRSVAAWQAAGPAQSDQTEERQALQALLDRCTGDLDLPMSPMTLPGPAWAGMARAAQALGRDPGPARAHAEAWNAAALATLPARDPARDPAC